MPSELAESMFPLETTKMQVNLLLRREDISSHVPCTRDYPEIARNAIQETAIYVR